MNYPLSYTEVLRLLISCRGCLFGGAVHDFLRGDTPRDLDVSVLDYSRFYDGLEALGYSSGEKGNVMVKGDIRVEVSENDNRDLCVDICISPDFDVNMLAWDGVTVFNYWDPEYDITEILHNIRIKRAQKLNPTSARIEKMTRYGWELY